MSDTKEYIVDKCYDLFLAHSYEAVSISDISKAIGMTKGALYHHFASKEDLFRSVVEKHLVLPVASCDLATISFSDFLESNIQEMRTLIDTYMNYSPQFTPLNYISFIIDASRHYKGFLDDKEKYVKEETAKTELVLKNSIERGEIRDDISVSVTAYMFTTVFMGFAGNLVMSKQDTDEAFNMLKQQIWEYYRLLKKE